LGFPRLLAMDFFLTSARIESWRWSLDSYAETTRVEATSLTTS